VWKGKPIVVYAMPGSQFTFKVLAALQSRQIPHFVDFSPLQFAARQKYLPSGGYLVPEVTIGGAKGGATNRAIVSDSERILHWFDDHYLVGDSLNDQKFFPTAQVATWSERANSQTLCGMVWYYGYVNEQGYANSMQQSFAKLLLPSWLPLGNNSILRNFIVDRLVASERQRYRAKVVDALAVEDALLDDEPAMRAKLVQELEFFQSLLVQPSTTQPFLWEGSSKSPTAADFSLYAQLNRLVGTTTADACDIAVAASLPQLKADTTQSLQRLWEWHAFMCTHYPGHFKGKRVPPATEH
jgi:hypothetical protein